MAHQPGNSETKVTVYYHGSPRVGKRPHGMEALPGRQTNGASNPWIAVTARAGRQRVVSLQDCRGDEPTVPACPSPFRIRL
jgi:hypothetical protein